MPVQKTCEECGQPFTAKPSQANIRRTCSMHCKMVAQVRRHRAEGVWKRPEKPRRGSVTACQVCLKPVYATGLQRSRGEGLYCSIDCQAASQRKGRVRKNCAYCGETMELRPCHGASRFCSRDCLGLAKTKRPLGRTHNGKPARLNLPGYVEVWEPTHPKAVKGWMPEHRLVAEQMLGRYLEPGEEVHHVNGRKSQNDPANLQVLGGSEHATITQQQIRDKIERLAEYEKRYGPLT